MGQELGEGLPLCRQGSSPSPRGVLSAEVSPSPAISPHVPVRPGLCPPMADSDRAATCLLLCLQDRDCPPGQKCCLQSCGRGCVPPLRGKTPPPATPGVPAAARSTRRSHPAAGPAWGPRGAQGGGTQGTPIPRGGSTHLALTASPISPRHSLVPAVSGCSRSCRSRPSAPPARRHRHRSDEPWGGSPAPPAPSSRAALPRAACRPHSPTPGPGSLRPRRGGKPPRPHQPQPLHSAGTE